MFGLDKLFSSLSQSGGKKSRVAKKAAPKRRPAKKVAPKRRPAKKVASKRRSHRGGENMEGGAFIQSLLMPQGASATATALGLAAAARSGHQIASSLSGTARKVASKASKVVKRRSYRGGDNMEMDDMEGGVHHRRRMNRHVGNMEGGDVEASGADDLELNLFQDGGKKAAAKRRPAKKVAAKRHPAKKVAPKRRPAKKVAPKRAVAKKVAPKRR